MGDVTQHDHDSLERSLTNQAPEGLAVIEAMEMLRVPAKTFGHAILAICPPGRERSIALTKLEEATMWAIKGLALNQSHVVPKDEGEAL